MKIIIKLNVFWVCISAANIMYGQNQDSSSKFNFHFQQTIITQEHPAFRADYSGENSLNNFAEAATSFTSTFYFGLRLSNNLGVYFDPEISGGNGISGAIGLAGFSNGETFRVSSTNPVMYPARIFLRYVINLNEAELDTLNNQPNQLYGIESKENITIILGKFGIADYFDNNEYSNDPRSQFLNWSLMNSGAWDYPADTRGYTWGLRIKYSNPDFALQFAAVMEPLRANGLRMDPNINKAFGLALELDKNYSLVNAPGIARLLFFYNRARMGSYSEVINNPALQMDITKSRKYGRDKLGCAFNFSQQINKNAGGFIRLSWNDGKNETWAFTEIDRSAAIGFTDNEVIMNKISSDLGIAFVINGISSLHSEYLSKGGHGFMIGDGKLNYSPENIFEAYLKLKIGRYLELTPDYQFVINPAYNKDRGPVNIFALRGHTEF